MKAILVAVLFLAACGAAERGGDLAVVGDLGVLGHLASCGYSAGGTWLGACAPGLVCTELEPCSGGGRVDPPSECLMPGEHECYAGVGDMALVTDAEMDGGM